MSDLNGSDMDNLTAVLKRVCVWSIFIGLAFYNIWHILMQCFIYLKASCCLCKKQCINLANVLGNLSMCMRNNSLTVSCFFDMVRF